MSYLGLDRTYLSPYNIRTLFHLSLEAQEKKMPFLVAFAPLAPGADLLSPHTLEACFAVVPPYPLSSTAKIHALIFFNVMNCTYLFEPAPPSPRLEHHELTLVTVQSGSRSAGFRADSRGCPPAPRQQPPPCRADVGHPLPATATLPHPSVLPPHLREGPSLMD